MTKHPTDFMVRPGDRQVELTWTPADGCREQRVYLRSGWGDNDYPGKVLAVLPAAASQHTLTSLDNGWGFGVQIAAVYDHTDLGEFEDRTQINYATPMAPDLTERRYQQYGDGNVCLKCGSLVGASWTQELHTAFFHQDADNDAAALAAREGKK